MATRYKQVILFGSPGTGKSHRITEDLVPDLGIDPEGENCIRTVFHPEYTYGDFMGKLMPLSKGGQVEYNFYTGYFMKALAQAYKNILNSVDGEEPAHVALVIDEINRGNSAAIFGTAFQLLDRRRDGWSDYKIDLSKMEFEQLLREIGFSIEQYKSSTKEYTQYTWNELVRQDDGVNELLKPLQIRRGQIRIPGNLSLIATMNTSDNSIYYMDAAFKRRWNWEFVDTTGRTPAAIGTAFST